MDDISMSKMDDSHSSNGYQHRSRAVSNEYQTGLPGHDVKYVQGREHRVSRNDRGDEVSI